MRTGRSGLLITVEGIDGSGKTTQVDRLCARLTEVGRAFVRTREPGGTPIGDKIRALLLDPASDMTALAEVYLYAASRAEHVARVMRPALEKGLIVVCDRFVDASIAYQGYGLRSAGITPDLVRQVNDQAVGGVMPTRTFVVDVPVQVASARLRASGRQQFGGEDRIERRGPAFFEQVRSGLTAIGQADPGRVVRVDGQQSVEQVAAEIWRDVEALLGRFDGPDA